MKAKTYKYLDIKNRTAWFRGYVESFDGRVKLITTCKEVHKTKGKALKDAKKLICKHQN